MPVARLLVRLDAAVDRFFAALFPRWPPGAVIGASYDVRMPVPASTSTPFSLTDLVGNGLLWAVPKSRRSIEKRLKRKYGSPGYHMKILVPKSNIRTCNTCGDDHLLNTLCPTCYKKVMDETQAMKTEIEKNLHLDPVEKEVVVLYEGEKDNNPSEYWEGKRIIEMKKPRPSWFSKNLMQRTTQKPAVTSDVKPSDLG